MLNKMSKNYELNKKYAIRKLSVGIASVSLGLFAVYNANLIPELNVVSVVKADEITNNSNETETFNYSDKNNKSEFISWLREKYNAAPQGKKPFLIWHKNNKKILLSTGLLNEKTQDLLNEELNFYLGEYSVIYSSGVWSKTLSHDETMEYLKQNRFYYGDENSEYNSWKQETIFDEDLLLNNLIDNFYKEEDPNGQKYFYLYYSKNKQMFVTAKQDLDIFDLKITVGIKPKVEEYEEGSAKFRKTTRYQVDPNNGQISERDVNIERIYDSTHPRGENRLEIKKETETKHYSTEYVYDYGQPIGQKRILEKGQDEIIEKTYNVQIDDDGNQSYSETPEVNQIQSLKKEIVGVGVPDAMNELNNFTGDNVNDGVWKKEEIPYDTEFEPDENLEFGEVELKQEGENGYRRRFIHYSLNFDTGELTSKLSEPVEPYPKIVQKPKSRIIKYGTKGIHIEHHYNQDKHRIENIYHKYTFQRHQDLTGKVDIDVKNLSLEEIKKYFKDSKQKYNLDMYVSPSTPENKARVEGEMIIDSDDGTTLTVYNPVDVGVVSIEGFNGGLEKPLENPEFDLNQKVSVTINYYKEGTKEKIIDSIVKEVTFNNNYTTEELPTDKQRIEETVINDDNSKSLKVTEYKLINKPSNSSGLIDNINPIGVNYEYKEIITIRPIESVNVKPNSPDEPNEKLNNKLIDTPVVGLPEYTDSLSINTPIDENGNLILPPIVEELPEFNGGVNPVDAPTAEKPEYTETLSTNTPVDEDDNLILPPTVENHKFNGGVNSIEPPIEEQSEYTDPISTNTPVDNNDDLMLPPVENKPEYTGDLTEKTKEEPDKETTKEERKVEDKKDKELPNTNSTSILASLVSSVIGTLSLGYKSRRRK